MLLIRDSQIKLMALPLRNIFFEKVLNYFKIEYPDIIVGNSDEEILNKLNLLFENVSDLNIKKEKSYMDYFLMCFLYKEDCQSLMKNTAIKEIICDNNFNETEKMYLINQILRKNGY